MGIGPAGAGDKERCTVSGRRIVHVTTERALEAAQETGWLRAESLSTQGFVHCCSPAQLAGVLERFFADTADPLALTLDTDRISARIVDEGADDGAGVFPHVYGPIEVGAIVEIAHPRRSMALTREEAWSHLCEWTETDALRRHARAVEIVMRAAAHRYGNGAEDVERFGIAGMLHDADYEKWPEDHPNRIVAWLRERGEDAIAHAISAHYTKWGVPYETTLDKALLACDELTGFVGAVCLVRPDGIVGMKPKSVKKKLKQKSFAAKVERTEVTAGAELLGVDLSEHIQFVIDALTPHAEELGLA